MTTTEQKQDHLQAQAAGVGLYLLDSPATREKTWFTSEAAARAASFSRFDEIVPHVVPTEPAALAAWLNANTIAD